MKKIIFYGFFVILAFAILLKPAQPFTKGNGKIALDFTTDMMKCFYVKRENESEYLQTTLDFSQNELLELKEIIKKSKPISYSNQSAIILGGEADHIFIKITDNEQYYTVKIYSDLEKTEGKYKIFDTALLSKVNQSEGPFWSWRIKVDSGEYFTVSNN